MQQTTIPTAARITGALMGAYIGDALALGPHWYYDLNKQREDFGPWITGYTQPKRGRYHEGCAAGDLSQAGFILRLTVQSLIESGEYNEAHFTRQMDEVLFPKLNGLPRSGPGGYTSQSIREAWKKRVVEKRDWGQVAGFADTTEAIERTIAIAARHAFNLNKMAVAVSSNAALTQADPTVLATTTAYNAVLALLIQGHPLDGDISGRLMDAVQSGVLPFYGAAKDAMDPTPPLAGQFASPDALLTPSYIAQTAADPDIQIEPAWKVSIVYGMPCAVYHTLPAAYYLAARFSGDFESALLHAVNGGGQNQARAILTGALVGAMVGIEGIPQRFLDGLTEGDSLLQACKQLAESAI